MRDFTRLAVWRRSFDLTIDLERALTGRTVRGIPGLRSQALRAAAAVSANICEGCGKASAREFLRYLDIAIASNTELYNHLLMARDINILDQRVHARLEAERTEVAKMLFAFRRAVERRNQAVSQRR